MKLWLWKNFVNGRPEYWAFDNPYPINIENDDPQTLGEPCGYAIFKSSRNGRPDVSEKRVLAAIARATPPQQEQAEERPKPILHINKDGIVFSTKNAEESLALLDDAARQIRERNDLAKEQAAPVQDGWMPIKTAPKDGKPILVSNGKDCAAVYWWPMVWMGTTHNGMKNPTHWMHLPAAPKVG